MVGKKQLTLLGMLSWILLFALVSCRIQAQEAVHLFPDSFYVPGWEKMGPEREFNKNGLYGHIDGGSELFLEMGFEILKLQKYGNATKDEIAIETYRMDSAEAALGIYLINCGTETPLPGIQERNSGDDYQVMVQKGQYYVKVNNFSGKSSLLPVLVQLANGTLKNIPQKPVADLFALLPLDNRVKSSELLIRGPYTLQAIFILGEGDILQLHNTIFGVSAQYLDEDKNTYTQIFVPYPDVTLARQAFDYLRQHLDSYIKVVETRDTFLSFTDFRGKKGIVEIAANIIHIKVNLTK